MNRISTALAAGLATTLITTPLLAQQQRGGISAECREEIMNMCGTDRSKIRSCVRENFSKLSEGCSNELKARMQARQQNGDSKSDKGSKDQSDN